MANASYESYFRRFGFCPRQIAFSPHPQLGLAVVIPCYDEPDLIPTLESLWASVRPACAVEVSIVVNSSEASPQRVLAQNDATLAQAGTWAAQHRDPAVGRDL